MLSLNNIGTDICHIGDFSIDRPNGSDDYLIIIFKTQALLTLNDSEIIAPSNSAVIFSKDSKQLYKSICGNYVNHFLHFNSDDESDLKDIVMDKLLHPDDIAGIENLLHMIGRENISESPNKNDYLSLLIRMVLLKVSEEGDLPDTQKINNHSHILKNLRAVMYNDPAKFHNIRQLAEEVGFSCSHFQQLYKKEFGLSCYEDLLIARIKTAQYYLGETDMSIREISRLCGYENDTCFLHRFKARTGLTPGEYRQRTSP